MINISGSPRTPNDLSPTITPYVDTVSVSIPHFPISPKSLNLRSYCAEIINPIGVKIPGKLVEVRVEHC